MRGEVVGLKSQLEEAMRSLEYTQKQLEQAHIDVSNAAACFLLGECVA